MADLTVTNAYSKGKAKTTLTINGNVEITNFKQGEAKPSAFVQAKVTEGKVNIQSNKCNASSLDLSDQKYSVMLKIAKSSKDDSGARELSWYDLRDTDKAKLGLDDSFEIKKDLKAGILNIYKKVGNKLTTWLHIDFETKTEKASEQSTSSSKSNETQKSSGTKTATLKYTRSELGGYDYSNKLTIPANTLIKSSRGLVYINSKGKAYKFNQKEETWQETNSLEFMGRTSARLMASIADNNGSNTDMTLNKKDLKFAKDPKSDLVDRFNHYKGKQAYYVKDLKITDSSIYANLGSGVFKDVEDSYIDIRFDVNEEKSNRGIKDAMLDGGRDNAEKIYNQIDGCSLNKNTFKLINDLSGRDLLKALRVYNKHEIVIDTKKESMGERYAGNGTFTSIGYDIDYEYNKNGMFQDLNNEWGIGIKEIMPIIDKAFNAIPKFLQKGKVYENLRNMINSVDRTKDENFDDNTIKQIDDLFAQL